MAISLYTDITKKDKVKADLTARRGERTNDMETITVKEVNGYKVEKYANTRGQYFVNIREGNGFREFHTFRTIKDAVKFIETAL